jgi:hypothetical protein
MPIRSKTEEPEMSRLMTAAVVFGGIVGPLIAIALLIYMSL